MLARAVIAEAQGAGNTVAALDRASLDVTDALAVMRTITAQRPDVVVQCAAYTRVDDAEHEPEVADLVNAHAAGHVADAAAACGAIFVYPSTDYVFDGSASAPYAPMQPPAPVSAYGRSKLSGEAAAARAGRYHVVRTSWLYGAGGRNFVSTMLQLGRAGKPLRVVDDQCGSPTWTVDLARMILRLVERDAPSGIYHATNAGHTTWYGFAREIFRRAGIAADVTPVTSAEFPRPARRPSWSVLDCAGTYAITGAAPPWQAALDRALQQGVE